MKLDITKSVLDQCDKPRPKADQFDRIHCWNILFLKKLHRTTLPRLLHYDPSTVDNIIWRITHILQLPYRINHVWLVMIGAVVLKWFIKTYGQK
ncbi:hypothetical protein BLOT_016670 [Blomia tropicalis]|nr:hypothetical protein BLOT_016670 [Blomia tropicalis]